MIDDLGWPWKVTCQMSYHIIYATLELFSGIDVCIKKQPAVIVRWRNCFLISDNVDPIWWIWTAIATRCSAVSLRQLSFLSIYVYCISLCMITGFEPGNVNKIANEMKISRTVTNRGRLSAATGLFLAHCTRQIDWIRSLDWKFFLVPSV